MAYLRRKKKKISNTLCVQATSHRSTNRRPQPRLYLATSLSRARVWKPDCARQNKRAGRWFPISAAADVKSTSVPVPVRVTVHLCALHPRTRYRRLRFLYGHPRSCPLRDRIPRIGADPKPLIRRVFSLRIYRRNIISAVSQQSLDLPLLDALGWNFSNNRTVHGLLSVRSTHLV